MKISVFSKFRVHWQLVIYSSVIILLTTIFFAFFTDMKQGEIFDDARKDQEEIFLSGFKKNVNITLKYVAQGLEYSTSDGNMDGELIQEIIDWVEQDSSVMCLYLYDTENKEEFLSKKFDRDEETELHAAYTLDELHKLVKSNDAMARLHIVSSEMQFGESKAELFIIFSKRELWEQKDAIAEQIKDKKRENFHAIFLRTILSLAAGFVLSLIFSRNITRPLYRLSSVARKIADGDMDSRADEESGGQEIKNLAYSFNRMIKKILDSQEELFSEMAKYNASLDDQNKNLMKANDALQNEISDRQAAEQALKESESMIRTIMDTAPISITYLNNDLRVVEINKLGADVFGVPESEIIGRDFKEMIPPDMYEEVTENINLAIDKNETVSMEMNIPFMGGLMNILSAISPHYSDEGKFLGLVLIEIDITQVKEAEKAVRESERLMRLMMDAAPATILYLDHDNRYLMANKAFHDMLGTSNTDLEGKYVGEFASIPDKIRMFEILDEVKDTKKNASLEECFTLLGKEMYFYVAVNPNFNEEGELIGTVVISIDVTEQKKAEEALRESRQRMDMALDAAQAGLWFRDHTTGKVIIDDRLKHILGYDDSDKIEENFDPGALIHPDDVELMNEKFNNYVARKNDNYSMEYRMKHKAGRWIWVDIKGKIVEVDPDGKVTKVIGTLIDITERKNAEAVIIENERLLSSIIDTAPANIMYMDGDFVFRKVNKAYTEMIGRSTEEIEGRRFDEIIPDNILVQLQSNIKKVLTSKEKELFEMEVEFGEEKKYFMVAVNPLFSEDKKVLHGIVIVVIDATQHKEAEQALIESEEKYRLLTENSSEVIMEFDKQRLIYVNQAYWKSFGIEKAENLSSWNPMYGWHPEDVKKYIELARSKEFYRDKTISVQFRAKGPNMTKWRWFEAMGNMYKTPDGSERAVIVSRDVTKSKEAAEAIKANELLLRIIIDTAPAAIMHVDEQGVIKKVNKAFLDLMNKEKSEVINRLAKDVIHKDIVGQIGGRVTEMLEKKQMVSFDLKLNFPDGPKFFYAALNPIFADNSDFLGYVYVGVDVSEQRKAAEALLESQVKFKVLTESAPDGIFILNDEEEVTFWNEAAENIFGYKKDDVLGLNPFMYIVPEEYHEEYVGKFCESKDTEKDILVLRNIEITAKNKSGKIFPVDISISTKKTQDKWMSIGIARDISERKAMQDNLKRAMEEAEAANKAKSEFLANMSHEIRTPMNAILGFSQLLQNKITNPQHKSYVDAINTSGKSLLSLINDILDLSKIEAGRLELEFEAVNPYNIFKEIKNIFSFKISEKGLEFLSDIDSDIPKGLILDEIRLRQVLVNLVGNALKFTESGHIKISAHKEYSENDESKLSLIFRVSDTGIGIPETQQEQIFEAFIQQSGQSTRKFGGTGLGLAISRRLVEMMGGEISVESKAGEGSKFEVRLHNIPVASVVSDSDNSAFGEEIELDLSGVVLLLVDDIEVNRRLIKEYFDKTNVEFMEAENGVQAIKYAKEFKPDLILMDMKMPEMNGYEATANIRASEGIKDIPIIALTASAMKGDEKKIKAAGCNGYLSKPVDKIALMNEIAKFMPEKVKKEEISNEQGDEDYTIDGTVDKNRLNNALEALNGELKERCDGLRKSLVIGAVAAFAESIIELGKETSISALTQYGRAIKGQAESFDLLNLRKSLDLYDEIIKQLNELA